MPYLFVKGQGNNVASTSVFVSVSSEKEVKKQLQIPDLPSASAQYGYQLFKTPLFILDALEKIGWRVVNVTGPEHDTGLYMWTLHAEPQQAQE